MYKVRNKQGFGGTDIEMQLQSAPYQDGATLIDQLFDPRDLSIGIFIFGDQSELADRRRMIARVFNPRLGLGQLHVVANNGVEYVLLCAPDGSPKFDEDSTQGAQHQLSTLELVAPDPFWRSVRISETPLAAFLGLFEFPFEFPMEFGIQSDYAYINNDGDVPCPINIEFNGPAVNPTIENVTTGEYITISRDLLENETLRINTAQGSKTVEITREDGTTENGWNYIRDYNISFFDLIVGENEIKYSADEGAEDATVVITYQKRYVGI
ncbi:phage tail family protein [Geomicrobium sp. JCM 19037]|uniref:phage tail family protein n=1 Tax=Geomicrobium sp. JCM 19037 TaxID=1460634 RepID=UPI00069499B9|nr:phage tail family protein [Geomicrobium sp. JCM 19037]